VAERCWPGMGALAKRCNRQAGASCDVSGG
jgi:hypothetical protein